MDNEKIVGMVSALYLALGSISLYLCISFIGFIAYYYLPFKTVTPGNTSVTYVFNLTGYELVIIITLVVGILLILSYHGFLHSRRYPRFTGIFGCGVLVTSFLYYAYDFIAVGREYLGVAPPSYIVAKVGQLSLGIASIILLVLTLIYWKKLA